jgi:hypothetical protein
LYIKLKDTPLFVTGKNVKLLIKGLEVLSLEKNLLESLIKLQNYVAEFIQSQRNEISFENYDIMISLFEETKKMVLDKKNNFI